MMRIFEAFVVAALPLVVVVAVTETQASAFIVSESSACSRTTRATRIRAVNGKDDRLINIDNADNNDSAERVGPMADGDDASHPLLVTAAAFTAKNDEHNRREFLRLSNVGLSGLAFASIAAPFQHQGAAYAATDDDTPEDPLSLQNRVESNLMTPPQYGLEGPDVFYPSWFAGTWNVESTTTDVQAPCGKALFGSNSTYNAALSEIGQTLKYASRFVPFKNDDDTVPSTCIADREYNVKSIARAAMGSQSVVDVPLVSPNKFSIVLSPAGSPSLLKVDLIALNRKQEPHTDNLNRFDCSEVVREIVASLPASGQAGATAPSSTSPLLKEVETISLYTYDDKAQSIRCRQRSASFLLPSQTNPVALKMWEASQGRPVDVRFYDVLYTKQ